MNDQPQLMNQHQVISHSQLMKQSQMLNQQSQMLNQLNQSQLVNQSQMMNPAQMVSQAQMVAQPPRPPPQMVNQSKTMSQSYSNWPQPSSNMPPMNTMNFPNPMMQMYGGGTMTGRSNWKGKKVMDKRKDMRRKGMVMPGGVGGGVVGGAAGSGVGGVGGGYKPPTLNELENQNRLKARRFYHKKKYNRMAPYAHAPRNTTSYIIRAKKSGGIASLVSPYPVTPAVLPTPVLSPSREALVEMAKEEWGVDGYGSMKGLIRLRSSPGHEAEVDDYEDDEEGGSSESDVEEHVEVERRLDHDLSRFEMIYPNYGAEYNNVLENRVDDQDSHIAQLEEENLILKERLYLMERELGVLRRRLQCLERQTQAVDEINEEVVENMSENESEGLHDVHFLRHKRDYEVNYVPAEEEAGQYGAKEQNDDEYMHTAPEGSVKKEVYPDESFENDGTNLDREVREKDVAVVDGGPQLDENVDAKDGKHENKQAGEICMGESGWHQSDSEGKATKHSTLDGERMMVEAKVENNDEELKDETAGDPCMEEVVREKVSEDARPED